MKQTNFHIFFLETVGTPSYPLCQRPLPPAQGPSTPSVRDPYPLLRVPLPPLSEGVGEDPYCFHKKLDEPSVQGGPPYPPAQSPPTRSTEI